MSNVNYRYDIKQGTDEWHNAKDLKLSASKATAIMANGKGLKTLVRELLTKHYSSGAHPAYSNEYRNEHMQRGNDYEASARMIYELETGNKVTEVGLVEMGEYVAVSPDGLVGEEGLLEIKNINDKDFLELIINKKIDSNHRNQMQMQMYVTGRKWCDYFVFNPNFNPNYFMVRIYPDMEEFSRLITGIQHGEQLIRTEKAMLDKMLKVGGDGN